VALSGHVAQQASGDFHAGAGAGARPPAELPQLAGRTRVLVDDVVDGERVELAGAEAIDGVGDVLEQLGSRALWYATTSARSA
jgi:beta-phosphoglucomutase-like phosphatase (HAD superfamily)